MKDIAARPCACVMGVCFVAPLYTSDLDLNNCGVTRTRIISGAQQGALPAIWPSGRNSQGGSWGGVSK